MPWVHEYKPITGGIAPCCHGYNLRGNETIANIKKSMLNGIKPRACSNCYKTEKESNWSYRIHETNNWLNKFGEPDVNNPQLNGVLTPNGTAEINGGLNGIVLFNKGTGSSFGQFIALDRQSPNRDCNLPMRIEVPFLVCPCEESKYSMLDGRLVSGENDCDGGARVYSVFLNGSSIQITN